MNKKNINHGFTLVELLVVMSILGVLVTLIAGGFRSSQARGRDAERKSDLKNIANAMELFYSDYGMYPSASAGAIVACPYISGGTSSSCAWGVGSFTDNRTVYFKTMPKDGSTGANYYYRIVDPPTNQKFQIFAYLENTKDPDCINSNCIAPGVTYSCGVGKTCNFAVTSPNTNATE